ncbi:MAG TPA: hypothetical protein VE990_16220 [Acidimicrobiales bacterium]|nr:hypothetical protein [Acidimicrobiales bacterium]
MTATPSHPHRRVRRDHRGWISPTFEPPNHRGDPDDGGPWNLIDPRRNQTAIAYTNNDTAILIHQAAVTLTIFRAPLGLGDAGATISVLVSLAAEADSQLWEAVADAHDQGYTWDQIADRLATSATTARRRFAAYTKWRNTQAEPG